MKMIAKASLLLIGFCLRSTAMPLIPSDMGDVVGLDGVSRLLVPSMHENLKKCIRQTRNGDTVYFQAVEPNYRTWDGGERGWHSWQGRCFVANDGLWRKRNPFWPWSGSKTLDELREFYRKAEERGGIFELENHTVEGSGWVRITGAPGVRVSGQLILCKNTTGEVTGPMTLGLMSDVNPALEQFEVNYVGTVKCCLVVQGDRWLVEQCQVRASGGTAVRCDGEANLRLQECGVGGLLGYDSDGRLCKASRALSVVGWSRCVAMGCAIEHTEVHKYDYSGGSGVKVSNGAEAIIEDCHLHSHDGVAVLFDPCGERGRRQPNSARVSIRNSVLQRAGVATFAARAGMEAAALSVRQSVLYRGLVWANDARPGTVEMEDVREAEGAAASPLVHEFHRALFCYTAKNPPTEEDKPEVEVEPAEVLDGARFESDSSSSGPEPDDGEPAWENLDELPPEMLQYRAQKLQAKIEKLKERGIDRPDRDMHYPPSE